MSTIEKSSTTPATTLSSLKAMTKKKEKELDPIERFKRILFLKGRHSSEILNDVMKDLTLLSKPHNKALTKKNDIVPFEDVNSLEFLGSKNDCGLFVLASHSKKRPNNLVIGRLFENHILDMFEFGVSNYQSIADFPGSKKGMGSKPLMVFLGEQWENDSIYSKVQNLLLDMFRGYKADKMCLAGVDHVITCAYHDGNIYVRGYFVNYQKSGTETPNLVLKPMGPFLDLQLRRNQLASDDMWKIACKKPKNIVPPKVKNIEKSSKGDKVARIHMKKQNLDAFGGRRVTALRGAKRPRDGDNTSEKSNKKSKA